MNINKEQIIKNFTFKNFIIILSVIFLILYIYKKDVYVPTNTDVWNTKNEFIKLQEEIIKSKEKTNKKLDSMSFKIDTLDNNFKKSKVNYITNKYITEKKYYTNEKEITNRNIDDYSIDSLFNILKSTKYESYERRNVESSKNSSTK